MNYQQLEAQFSQLDGVARSTMMGTPCLRYKGEFFAMVFEKQDSLIIKVSADRVNELIANGQGNEFNFTKKRFKEWVLIPIEFDDKFESYLQEALEYARLKTG